MHVSETCDYLRVTWDLDCTFVARTHERPKPDRHGTSHMLVEGCAIPGPPGELTQRLHDRLGAQPVGSADAHGTADVQALLADVVERLAATGPGTAHDDER